MPCKFIIEALLSVGCLPRMSLVFVIVYYSSEYGVYCSSIKRGKTTSECFYLFCRNGKMESATVGYVQRQSITFFNSILESSVEFRKAFQSPPPLGGGGGGAGTSQSSKQAASFLSWIEEELTKFCTERIEKQVM